MLSACSDYFTFINLFLVTNHDYVFDVLFNIYMCLYIIQENLIKASKANPVTEILQQPTLPIELVITVECIAHKSQYKLN